MILVNSGINFRIVYLNVWLQRKARSTLEDTIFENMSSRLRSIRREKDVDVSQRLVIYEHWVGWVTAGEVAGLSERQPCR